MKKHKILCLLFCVLLISTFGYGQEIPKKANLVILVTDSLNNLDLFRECVMILKSEGNTFDQIDMDFFMCTMNPKRPGKLDMEYRLDISVMDNKAEIRSYVRSIEHFSGNPVGAWERGANRSLATSSWRYGWDEQVKYANQLKDKISGSIDYIVEGLK